VRFRNSKPKVQTGRPKLIYIYDVATLDFRTDRGALLSRLTRRAGTNPRAAYTIFLSTMAIGKRPQNEHLVSLPIY
jgi:hypothetical protein